MVAHVGPANGAPARAKGDWPERSVSSGRVAIAKCFTAAGTGSVGSCDAVTGFKLAGIADGAKRVGHQRATAGVRSRAQGNDLDRRVETRDLDPGPRCASLGRAIDRDPACGREPPARRTPKDAGEPERGISLHLRIRLDVSCAWTIIAQ
jgi:hypothetical protein